MRHLKRPVWGVLLLLVNIGPAGAADAGSYFVSAKAGMINYVEGRPTVSQGELSDPSRLSPRHHLDEGDLLQTAADERVEILFNPGTYLRVGENSRVRVLATGFEDMRFALDQGSAILESLSLRRKVHRLLIMTPVADLKVLKKGLYRFEVDAVGQVQVAVFRGKLRWVQGRTRIATLKSGRIFDLNRSGKEQLYFSRVGKNPFDGLDQWSRERAQTLIGANAKVPTWVTRSALSRYGRRATGGWVYEPLSRMYTFVPFHYRLSSPYGFIYRNFSPTWRTYGYGGSPTPSRSVRGGNSGWSPSTTSRQRSSPASRRASATGQRSQQSRSSARSSTRRR